MTSGKKIIIAVLVLVLATGAATAAVSGIDLRITKNEITVDENSTAITVIQYDDGSSEVTTNNTSYKSYNPDVATVNDSGHIEAKNPGTATIVATYEEQGSTYEDTAVVTVKPEYATEFDRGLGVMVFGVVGILTWVTFRLRSLASLMSWVFMITFVVTALLGVSTLRLAYVMFVFHGFVVVATGVKGLG